MSEEACARSLAARRVLPVSFLQIEHIHIQIRPVTDHSLRFLGVINM